MRPKRSSARSRKARKLNLKFEIADLRFQISNSILYLHPPAYFARLLCSTVLERKMSLKSKPGSNFQVTISKAVTRAAALTTLERLSMRDKVFAEPLEARAANFKARPKRRGGRIWTKWPNKIHPK